MHIGHNIHPAQPVFDSLSGALTNSTTVVMLTRICLTWEHLLTKNSTNCSMSVSNLKPLNRTVSNKIISLVMLAVTFQRGFTGA